MDVWGLASALSDAVKKTSQDFVDTVRNTEWKNEFADIRKEIEEDTSEITNNAKTLTEKINQETAKVVEKTGLKETVGLWEHDVAKDQSEKTVWISESTDAKVHAIGKKILQGTGQTYEALTKAFRDELGLGPNTNASLDVTNNSKNSRLQSAIESLEKNNETFELDPEDHVAFEAWKQEPHSVPAPKVLSAMLEESHDLHEMYERLVPEKVTHEEFWNRYLFKLQIVEKRQVLLAQAAIRSSNVESNEVEWDDTWEEQVDEENTENEEGVASSDEKSVAVGTKPELEHTEQDESLSLEQHAGIEPDTAVEEIDASLDSSDQRPEAEEDHRDLKGSPDEALSESSLDDVTNWE